MSDYRNLLRFISAAAALGLFIASWAILHEGWFKRGEIIDTPVYESYGDEMANSRAPYLDFSVEYPPAALPVFLIPSIGHEGDSDAYRRSFETLMIACGAVLMLSLAAALAALNASLTRYWCALALAAVSPLLLGSVILSRFDLWPTALTAGALAALLWGRLRLGHALLAVGIAAKLWPGVLVPLALAYVWRTRGRREALSCLTVAVVVVAACIVPFAWIAPHGVWSSFERQASRPLQIESLGAAFIVASHHIAGTGVVMDSSHGSQNIAGTTANVVGGVLAVAQIAVLVALWVVFARRERNKEELVQYAAAAVVAFIALGKVLSPQYLIWLIALVPLVRRWSAWGLYVAALVLTQAWFPHHYWGYALHFQTTESWLVLARDLVLVALLVVLVLPRGVSLRRRRVPIGHDPKRHDRGQTPAMSASDTSPLVEPGRVGVEARAAPRRARADLFRFGPWPLGTARPGAAGRAPRRASSSPA
jgi:hypothetical protein